MTLSAEVEVELRFQRGLRVVGQIMIKNEGRAALAIDALTPLHTQPEIHDDGHAGGPAKPRVRQ